MNKIILLTGGARSGKSRLAAEMASKAGKSVVYIATCELCEPLDQEMLARVRKHQKDRPAAWRTIEEQLNLTKAFKKIKKRPDAVIVDCLTLYVTNHLMINKTDKQIISSVLQGVRAARKLDCPVFFITNEIGSGIVPLDPLSRRFRDVAGFVNQSVAKMADEAFAIISGYPVRLK